jgi:hypothetical protein
VAVKAPAELAARGAAFWSHAVDTYELSETKLSLHTEVCRLMDECEALRQAVVAQECSTVLGSTGQARVHPAIGERELAELTDRSFPAVRNILDKHGSGAGLPALRPLRMASPSPPHARAGASAVSPTPTVPPVPDDDVRRFDPLRLVEVERDVQWWPEPSRHCSGGAAVSVGGRRLR